MGRRRRLLAALLATAFLAACSPPLQGPRTTNEGGEVVSLPPPVSVESVESTIDDSPTQTGVREDTVAPAEQSFCERMRTYLDATDFELTGANPDEAPPSRQSLEEMAAALTAMRPVASAEVQGAIDTYAAAIGDLLDLLGAHGYDMEAALKSPDADKIRGVVSDPKVIEADRVLNDASASVCGYVRT